MKIELEVIDHPGGGSTVLVPEWRVKASIQALRKQAESASLEEERKLLITNAESIEAYQADIRAKFAEKIVVRSYEAKPYTRRAKLDAKRKATSWVDGASRFDEDLYVTEIVAWCLGKDPKEVDDMDPSIVPALYTEIRERSEPDPSKLDFLPS